MEMVTRLNLADQSPESAPLGWPGELIPADGHQLFVQKFKNISPELRSKAHRLQRLSQSPQPFLQKIVSCFEKDDQFTLVAENSSGPFLYQIIEQEEWDKNTLIKFCQNLLSGLQALESLELCHGQLNAYTISLATTHWQAHCVRLENQDLKTDTFDPILLTTLAPEIWEGQEPDLRTDFYALGVLLYQIITGRPPYSADNLHDLRKTVLEAALIPPRQLNPQIDRGWDHLCQNLLARQAEHRPRRVNDVLRQVEMIRDLMIPPLTPWPYLDRARPGWEDEKRLCDYCLQPFALSALTLHHQQVSCVDCLADHQNKTLPTANLKSAWDKLSSHRKASPIKKWIWPLSALAAFALWLVMFYPKPEAPSEILEKKQTPEMVPGLNEFPQPNQAPRDWSQQWCLQDMQNLKSLLESSQKISSQDVDIPYLISRGLLPEDIYDQWSARGYRLEIQEQFDGAFNILSIPIPFAGEKGYLPSLLLDEQGQWHRALGRPATSTDPGLSAENRKRSTEN